MRTRISSPSHIGPQVSLQDMRQQVATAATKSVDMDKLYLCLMMLSQAQKPYKSKYRKKTDEELEEELAGLPSLDERDYSYLDNIDYSKYKPVMSPSVAKIIAKWL